MSDINKKLAIFGGDPVRKELLPYGKQSIDEDDIKSVVDVLRSDFITTGPKVEEFEKCFADFVGSKYAVSFSSGTAALHGSIFAANIKDGDEVITTPLTFCATSNCILYQGAKPVFADVKSDSLNINPKEIENNITNQTKAIIPVDYAGHPADLDEISEIAKNNKITVIEDGCHALGAEYKGKRIGSISNMTVFSFHPVKHITTGEGGMVTTNDDNLAIRLRKFRNHGINFDSRQRQKRDEWFYEIDELGYNYRLADINCALGISQLKKINKNLIIRRNIVKEYNNSLSNLEKIILPTENPYVSSAWHIYPIRISLNKLKSSREFIFKALRAENIGVNVHYIPIHYHPLYKRLFGSMVGKLPVCEEAYESLITLPIFHGMTDDDVQDVIKAVKKVLHSCL